MAEPLMTETDLRQLQGFLAHDDEITDDARMRAALWAQRMLEVREAQRTRNHGPFHQSLIEAFHLATRQWEADREYATNHYAAEVAEWEAANPRPTLKEFMMNHRHHPSVICPACGTEFEVER